MRNNNTNRVDSKTPNHIYLDQQWALLLLFVVSIISSILFIGFCIIRKKKKTTTTTEVRQVTSNSFSLSSSHAFSSSFNIRTKPDQLSKVEEIHIPQQPRTPSSHISESTSITSYELNGNDFFSTKAALPKLALPKISDIVGLNRSFQSTLAPEPKMLHPDTPPSILITNTDSPSFNLAHQKLVSAPVAHPLAVPNTDTVMATLLGDIFLMKVNRTVEVGQNSEGTIYKGSWQGAHVVMRPIRSDKIRQLRDDIVILKNLRHPNIVIFFGLYQVPGEQEMSVVTEYTEHGNLKEFLKSHNPDYIYKQQLVLFQQQKEAEQIRKEHQDIFPSHFTISAAEFHMQVQAKKEKDAMKHAQITPGTNVRSSIPHSHSQSDLSSMFYDLPDSVTGATLSMLTSRDLVKLSRDIAAGMMQLEQKSFAHRNLSAGSIVVGGSLPGNLIAKLSEFGLTRHIQFTPSPRWTSPEALQTKRYTTRSDLWSYGITLYEIFTFGRLPYDDMAESQILNWVLEGNRLPFSSSTPPIVQTIAYRCWDLNLAKRPTFDEIFELLDNYLQSPYFK